MKKPARLVQYVEFLYVLIKCSIYFWGWLVKDGFLYGWVSAQRKLFFCIDHPEALQERLGGVTKSVTPSRLWEKTLSTCLFLAIAIFGSGIWLADSQLGLFLMVASALTLIFLLLLVTHVALFPSIKKIQLDPEMGYQLLRQTLTPNLLNGFILVTYLFWVLLLPVNPLLFIFVAPGGVAYLLKKGQQKYYEREGNPHDYRQS